MIDNKTDLDKEMKNKQKILIKGISRDDIKCYLIETDLTHLKNSLGKFLSEESYENDMENLAVIIIN